MLVQWVALWALLLFISNPAFSHAGYLEVVKVDISSLLGPWQDECDKCRIAGSSAAYSGRDSMGRPEFLCWIFCGRSLTALQQGLDVAGDTLG